MRTALFVGRRLVGLVITVFIASVLIFMAFALAPGDPAATIAGGVAPNPATLHQIQLQFHLNDPLWLRYGNWVGDLLTGHLGTSFVYRADVVSLIGPRLGTSLLLVAYAAILIVVFGIGSGVVAGLAGPKTDRSVTVVGSIMMGAPTFVVAILLIWVFSQELNWFPVYGTGSGFGDQLWHLTLPAIALSCAYLAFVSRVTRTSVRAQRYSEHVETARSRGIPWPKTVRRHILWNATPEILAVSGVAIAGLIAGTAVAERAFGINGIGSLLVDAASRKDLPVVLILSMIIVVVFVLVSTFVDVINALIDPRVADRSAL